MSPSRQLTLGPHFAQSVASRPALGVQLWEFHYAPWQRIPRHGHEIGYICFLIAGDLIETDGPHSLSYSADRTVYVPPGTQHEARAGPDGALMLGLELSDEASCLGHMATTLPARVTQLQSPSANLTLHRAMLHSRNGESHLLPSTWLFELVSNLLPEPKRESTLWLQRLLSYLHADHCGPISATALAAVTDRHPAHVMRSFRSHTGMTIGTYLQKLRLDTAARQLATGHDAISTIAMRCGFADQSHLSRLFRKEFKRSPTSFRAAFRDLPVASGRRGASPAL